jgi:hypothetical protein
MRKTIATIVVLGLALIGYTAWPLYELLVLVRAQARLSRSTARPLRLRLALKPRGRLLVWRVAKLVPPA